MNIFDLLYEDFKLDITRPIRLFEAFSGIGTQYMSLKRLGLDIEIVGISEVDRFALKSHKLIHGGGIKNYGGIGSFESLPNDIDIATWSFPCQDISLAGQQKGMVEGSQSNYGYDFLDTVERTERKPKILLMENVRALFSQTFIEDWREIQLRLEKMGYRNYAEILNAKDFGVAQNRDRVFIVSILGDYNYTFPKEFELEKKLKDYLEEDVDEKYFLSQKMIDTFMSKGTGKYPRRERFLQNITRENQDVANAITTLAGGRPTDNFILIPEATKQGYAKAYEGDGIYIDRPHQKGGVVQKGMVPTIKTQNKDIGVVVLDGERLRIRKLTERETWRLMGVTDEDYDKVKDKLSSTQLYKQAGNAIVVDVLYYIFKEMI